MTKSMSAWLAGLCVGASAGAAGAALEPIAVVDLPSYLGTWYQVALVPNRFQSSCVSDTTATYRERKDGNIDVINRCRRADGSFDEAVGLARPRGEVAGSQLRPARLEVSFLPQWLRWAQAIGGWGWGAYWVIQLAPDYRYAVVGESSREYLWVLSRTPELAPEDDVAIRATLQKQGFDLTRLQAHTHGKRQAQP